MAKTGGTGFKYKEWGLKPRGDHIPVTTKI